MDFYKILHVQNKILRCLMYLEPKTSSESVRRTAYLDYLGFSDDKLRGKWVKSGSDYSFYPKDGGGRAYVTPSETLKQEDVIDISDPPQEFEFSLIDGLRDIRNYVDNLQLEAHFKELYINAIDSALLFVKEPDSLPNDSNIARQIVDEFFNCSLALQFDQVEQKLLNISNGAISPLLANIALHGMETALVDSLPKSRKPAIIRYADDFVILHEDLPTLLKLKALAEQWLAKLGLNLKAAKTRITHTLNQYEGHVGFDFLGFTVRQFPMSKRHARLGYKTFIKPSKLSQQRHLAEMAEVIHKHRGSNQTALLTELNPKIRGWTNYYRACTAKKVFDGSNNVAKTVLDYSVRISRAQLRPNYGDGFSAHEATSSSPGQDANRKKGEPKRDESKKT